MPQSPTHPIVLKSLYNAIKTSKPTHQYQFSMTEGNNGYYPAESFHGDENDGFLLDSRGSSEDMPPVHHHHHKLQPKRWKPLNEEELLQLHLTEKQSSHHLNNSNNHSNPRRKRKLCSVSGHSHSLQQPQIHSSISASRQNGTYARKPNPHLMNHFNAFQNETNRRRERNRAQTAMASRGANTHHNQPLEPIATQQHLLDNTTGGRRTVLEPLHQNETASGIIHDSTIQQQQQPSDLSNERASQEKESNAPQHHQDDDNHSTISDIYIPFHSHHQQRLPAMMQKRAAEMRKQRQECTSSGGEDALSVDSFNGDSSTSRVVGATSPDTTRGGFHPIHDVYSSSMDRNDRGHASKSPPRTDTYTDNYFDRMRIRSHTVPTLHSDRHFNHPQYNRLSSPCPPVLDRAISPTIDASKYPPPQFNRSSLWTAPHMQHPHFQSSVKNATLTDPDTHKDGTPLDLDTVQLVSRHQILNNTSSTTGSLGKHAPPPPATRHMKRGKKCKFNSRQLVPLKNRPPHEQSLVVKKPASPQTRQQKSTSKSHVNKKPQKSTSAPTNSLDLLQSLDAINSRALNTQGESETLPTLDDFHAALKLPEDEKQEDTSSPKEDAVHDALAKNDALMNHLSEISGNQSKEHDDSLNLLSYLEPQTGTSSSTFPESIDINNPGQLSHDQILSFLNNPGIEIETKNVFFHNVLLNRDANGQDAVLRFLLLNFEYVLPRFANDPQTLLGEFKLVNGFPYYCDDGLRCIYDALVASIPYASDPTDELCAQLLQTLRSHEHDSLVGKFTASLRELKSKLKTAPSRSNKNTSIVSTIYTLYPISGICVSPDDEYALTWCPQTPSIQAWSFTDATNVSALSLPEGATAVSVSSKNNLIFAAYKGGNIRAIDYSSGKVLSQFRIPLDQEVSQLIHLELPLEDSFEDQSFRMGDQHGNLLLIVYRNKMDLFSFTPQESGSSRKKRRGRQWKCLQTFTGHTRVISLVNYSPEHRILVSMCQDLRIRKYSLDTLHSQAFGMEYELHRLSIPVEIELRGQSKVVQIHVLEASLFECHNQELPPHGKILVSLSHETRFYDLTFGNLVSTIPHSGDWSVDECLVDYPYMYTTSRLYPGVLKRTFIGENGAAPLDAFLRLEFASYEGPCPQVLSMSLMRKRSRTYILFATDQRIIQLVHVDNEKLWHPVLQSDDDLNQPKFNLQQRPPTADITQPQDALLEEPMERTTELKNFSQQLKDGGTRKRPSFLGITLSTSKQLRHLEKTMQRKRKKQEAKQKHDKLEQLHKTWNSQRKRWNALSVLKNKSSDIAELHENQNIPGLKQIGRSQLDKYVVKM